MRVINTKTPNMALHHGLIHLANFGVTRQSRNGEVIVAPTPIMTVWEDPTNRVIFGNTRDANPFLHLFEALWMLDGRDDLAFMEKLAARFAQFSDDGERLHGAYGKRWRSWFGYDQLETIITELSSNPESRRAVLAMWDGGQAWAAEDNHMADSDLATAISGGKDVPCNTHVYFDIGERGVLNMTVCCRSNDILWGAYGANIVHFSILQEYMAARIGVSIGKMYQLSNNYHVYPAALMEKANKRLSQIAIDISQEGAFYFMDRPILKVPLFQYGEDEAFHKDLALFMQHFDNGAPMYEEALHTRFFKGVIRPMLEAWLAWKDKAMPEALAHARSIVADDWRTAVLEFLQKRVK